MKERKGKKWRNYERKRDKPGRERELDKGERSGERDVVRGRKD